MTGLSLEPTSEQNLFEKLDLKERLEEEYIVDIRDYESVKNATERIEPEVVLHLAAQPLVREGYKDPLGTWETNVQGSLNILQALKNKRVPCAVIMVTTDKVYENREWEYGYRESDRLGGRSIVQVRLLLIE